MSAISELSTLSKTRAEPGRRENLAAYLFLAPWLVGLVLITVGPMLASLYLSFTDYNLLQAPTWIGLENYARMFADDRGCTTRSRVTFIYVLVSVPLQLALALLLAVLLDRGLRGLAFYRSVFYLPSLLGAQRRDRRSCGGRSSAPTGWSTSVLGVVRRSTGTELDLRPGVRRCGR